MLKPYPPPPDPQVYAETEAARIRDMQRRTLATDVFNISNVLTGEAQGTGYGA